MIPIEIKQQPVRLFGKAAFHDRLTELSVIKDKLSDELGSDPGELPKPNLVMGLEHNLVMLHRVPILWATDLRTLVPAVKVNRALVKDTFGISDSYETCIEFLTDKKQTTPLFINPNTQSKSSFEGWKTIKGFLYEVHHVYLYDAKVLRLIFQELNIDEKYIRPIVCVSMLSDKTRVAKIAFHRSDNSQVAWDIGWW